MTRPCSSTSLILSRRFAGHACSSARCRAGLLFFPPRPPPPPPPLMPLAAPAVVLAVSSLGRLTCAARATGDPPGVPVAGADARLAPWAAADTRNPGGGDPFGWAIDGWAIMCGCARCPAARILCWCCATPGGPVYIP